MQRALVAVTAIVVVRLCVWLQVNVELRAYTAALDALSIRKALSIAMNVSSIGNSYLQVCWRVLECAQCAEIGSCRRWFVRGRGVPAPFNAY